MAGKYSRLCEHLRALKEAEWRASFAEIEDVLRRNLPASARSHAAWWSNGGHSHARAWLDAGFKTSELDLSRQTVLFREQGIGWEMENGKVRYRGAEPFARTVKGAATDLSNTGRPQAASELAEAVKDISRRPKPDITGAVQHAMAALEATARDVTGQNKPTLGKLVGSLGLTPPLDAALEKLWGYASNEARHGREDVKLSPAEAELIVGVSGAVCGYLAKTNPEPGVAGSDN